MSKIVEMGMNDGVFELKVDPNQDGQEVFKLKMFTSEVIQEAISREKSIEGAKLVSFGFEGSKLKLSLDTDKDGEILLELEIDLMEIFDEFSKKE